MTEVKRCYNQRVEDIDREVDRAYLRAIDAAWELDAIAGGDTLIGRPDPPAAFAFRGNEPFWDLILDGERAGYGCPDSGAGRVAATLTGNLSSLDHLKPRTFVWRGREVTMPGDFVAMITRERRVDTMAEEGPSGGVRVGCCSAPH